MSLIQDFSDKFNVVLEAPWERDDAITDNHPDVLVFKCNISELKRLNKILVMADGTKKIVNPLKRSVTRRAWDKETNKFLKGDDFTRIENNEFWGTGWIYMEETKSTTEKFGEPPTEHLTTISLFIIDDE